MQGFIFCGIFLIVMFLINVVLPVFVLYKLGRWIWRRIQGETKPETNAVPAEDLAAALARSRAETQAARAETETIRAAAEAAGKKLAQEEKIAVLKTQGNMDRLALVYYVEDALKSGQTAGDIAAALRAKGWPEEEIAAVVPGGEETAPA